MKLVKCSKCGIDNLAESPKCGVCHGVLQKFAVGSTRAINPSASPEFLCLRCGCAGSPKKYMKGQFVVEVVLWLVFLYGLENHGRVVGLITFLLAGGYSLSRYLSKYLGCSFCGWVDITSVDSPAAKKFLADRGR
jgi:hypothetical protein